MTTNDPYDEHPVNERNLSTHGVTQVIAMECVDAAGAVTILDVAFDYDPADPYAVTASFLTAADCVVWTFARELLARGLTAAAGEGDVHVWPGLDSNGRATVIVELCSPDGELVTQAHTHDIYRFVARSLDVVPAGTESGRLDLDQLIEQLLQPELG